MNRSKNQAIGLADLIVALALFMLLTAALFVIFFLGGKAWRKSDDRYELLRNTQVVQSQFAREAERSSVFSVTVLPGRAVCFLSPINDAGNPSSDAYGDVRWERYIIFYHDPATQEVRELEVPLLPSSFEHSTPQPIERFLSATGVHPLADYLSGGRVVGRGIQRFQPDLPAGGQRLNLRLYTVQPGRGADPDLTLDTTTHVLMRN